MTVGVLHARVPMTAKHCVTLLTGLVLFQSVVGCGSNATTTRKPAPRGTNGAGATSGASGGTNGGARPVPNQHRPADTTCPEQRGAGLASVSDSCFGPGFGTVGCMQDSDCMGGTDGRCLGDRHPCVTNCSYDTCFSDSDCPSNQPCECRQSASDSAGNACMVGSNCRIDADCGPGGFCSPSIVESDCSSRSQDTGYGYFCHTPQDSCLNHSDCDPRANCVYSLQAARWTCTTCPVAL